MATTRLRPFLKARPASPAGIDAADHDLAARADALALRLSAAPGSVLAVLLAGNVVLAAVGVLLGSVLAGDSALYFRELAPGTWISAGHMLAAAIVAQAIHRRHEGGPPGRHVSFWSLSALLLTGLAVVELTQPTVFLGHWLQDELGVRAPSGIADVDAMLVIGLLTAVGAVLLSRARVLLRYPRSLALFAVCAVLGAASQTLDALWPVSTWEFVVEDGLKALAEPFLVAGFLVVLSAQRKNGPHTVSGD